jgi:hypothetical protein
LRAGRGQSQSLSVIEMPAETRILDPMAELISIVSVAPDPPHWPTPPDVTPRSH